MKSIETKNSKINFFTSRDNGIVQKGEYDPHWQKLDSIQFISKATNKVLSSTSFKYTEGRCFLESVKESSKLPYEFKYNRKMDIGYDFKALDHWGYYNGFIGNTMIGGAIINMPNDGIYFPPMNGMPVMITAYANTYTTGWWFWKQTHYSDGHAWVIDGIVDNTRNIKYGYIWKRVFVPDNPSGPHEEQIMPIYDISDLYSQYEEVLTLDEANLRGIFPGDRETRTDTYTTTNILMNWGWNGSYDGQYSPYASSWTGGGYNFQYTRKIYYNIRKI